MELTLRSSLTLKEGEHFRVEILAGYVRKFPKTDFHKANLEKLVMWQNYLAGHIKGVIKAEYHGDHLTMPVPPGRQADEYPENVYYDRIRPQVERMTKEAKRYGFNFQDILAPDNIYYDDENDQVYAVDYSSLEMRADNPGFAQS